MGNQGVRMAALRQRGFGNEVFTAGMGDLRYSTSCTCDGAGRRGHAARPSNFFLISNQRALSASAGQFPVVAAIREPGVARRATGLARQPSAAQAPSLRLGSAVADGWPLCGREASETRFLLRGWVTCVTQQVVRAMGRGGAGTPPRPSNFFQFFNLRAQFVGRPVSSCRCNSRTWRCAARNWSCAAAFCCASAVASARVCCC